MNNMGKFSNLQLFPWRLWGGGAVIPKGIVTVHGVYRRGGGVGLAAFLYCWSLKKDTRNFNFRSNESSLDI